MKALHFLDLVELVQYFKDIEEMISSSIKWWSDLWSVRNDAMLRCAQKTNNRRAIEETRRKRRHQEKYYCHFKENMLLKDRWKAKISRNGVTRKLPWEEIIIVVSEPDYVEFKDQNNKRLSWRWFNTRNSVNKASVTQQSINWTELAQFAKRPCQKTME